MRFLTWIWRKVACLAIGHNIDPCDCYAEECFRCGLTFNFDKPPRNDIGFWLDYFEFKNWWRASFLGRQCECCGCRLKRGQDWICDSNKCADDWMPF